MPFKSPSSARSSPKTTPHTSPRAAPAALATRRQSDPTLASLETAHAALSAITSVTGAVAHLPLAECIAVVSTILSLADEAVVCRASARRLALRCDELVRSIKGSVDADGGAGKLPDSWDRNVRQLQNNLGDVRAVLATLAKRGFFYVVIHRPIITDQLDDATQLIQDSVMAFMIGSMVAQGAWAKQMQEDRDRDTATLSKQLLAISTKLDAMQSRAQVLSVLQIHDGEEAASMEDLTRRVPAVSIVETAETITRVTTPGETRMSASGSMAIDVPLAKPATTVNAPLDAAALKALTDSIGLSRGRHLVGASVSASAAYMRVVQASNTSSAGRPPNGGRDSDLFELDNAEAPASPVLASPASPAVFFGGAAVTRVTLARSRSADVSPSPISGETEFFRKALDAFRRTGVSSNMEHESVSRARRRLDEQARR